MIYITDFIPTTSKPSALSELKSYLWLIPVAFFVGLIMGWTS